MSLGNDIVIEPYETRDRAALRRIACTTAFFGKGQAFLEDPEVLADALTLYFTDYEPESCFVARKEAEVVGYVMGTTNVRRLHRVMTWRVVPAVVGKALARGFFWRRKNFLFCWHSFLSFLKGEFLHPDFAAEFPAILHINIDAAYRRAGLGTEMVSLYLDYLKGRGVQGIHVGTTTGDVQRFFVRQGFEVLFQAQRSYLRYALGHDVPCMVLGKRL